MQYLKKATLCISPAIFLLLYIPSFAQKQIHLSSGYSRHGSGDFPGIFWEFGYKKSYPKRFSLKYNVRTTINDGKDVIIVHNSITGQRTDASVRFTTAGIQVGIDMGISPLRTKKSDVTVSLGCFARYQSASNGSDGYSLYGPPATGVPAVLIGYDNKTPQRTISLGGTFLINYFQLIKQKVGIGPVAGFQTDTNGDLIVLAGCNVVITL